MAADMPEYDLWTYAVALYERPGVREACLSLQDSVGLDVNVILFCCYGASTGCDPFDRAMWDAVMGVSRRWQGGVVAPLRQARRMLKPMAEDSDTAPAHLLYNRVVQVELDVERLELADLEKLIAAKKPGLRKPSVALANLDAYTQVVGAPLTAAGQQAIGVIARAAIEDAL